jgi:hypothetical protein
MTDVGTPQPTENDALFAPGDDWTNNAVLHIRQPVTAEAAAEELYAYVEGYRLAADALVEHVMRTGIKQDLLVYPVVFLYRHWLELSMKDIIRLARPLCGEPPTYRPQHNLGVLWTCCEELLSKIEPRIAKDDLHPVRNVVAQMEAVDPTGEGFRYPTKSDGVTPCLPDLRYINLRNLRDQMCEPANCLEAARMMLCAYLDQKSEMDEALRGLYE